jgi:hypothetical protein
MIHVKVIANRFVTCYPAPPPKPEEEEAWPQTVMHSARERARRHRITADEPARGMIEYAMTKADHAELG